MDHHDDTEMLIALVSSLLDHAVGHEAILEALVLADGDAQRAADVLNDNKSKGKQKRRKKETLDGWLGKPKPPPPPQVELVGLNRASGEPSTSVIKPISKGAPQSKPPIDLMTILRPPPSPDKDKRKLKGLPPLTLITPSMVATHTPCTLHLSILPPELASRLFYTMIEAAQKWQRNKWWLFDRVVESPHRTSFYARTKDDDAGDARDWQEAARFWYNGRMTDPPKEFPSEMEQACRIIEQVVNEELSKRKRYPLEYAGNQQGNSGFINPVWRANVAASNCYEGAKESVGPHSDQLTYLGPYPTIASLSLGTTRVFRLREVIPTDETESRNARTFNIPLSHNSLTIMHASCQEKFKHSIPPQSTIDIFRPKASDVATNLGDSTSSEQTFSSPSSNCRINITFRFYRPDFRPQSIPKCDCGVQTILRADMKNRTDGRTDKYWWTCYAGAQNEGKGCKFWKVMDMKKEGRGPCVGDIDTSARPNLAEEEKRSPQ